ncbi:hypothetical protein W97_01329 [Coniosporium apollinis CBS 100218]|uniref:DUF3752 domain-containing protein n=1 Tax=Coniosporium apollinis (strain CBS 100218) TaxID=1168221 RepID=R7YJQ1_CONA1|nr:uncharacterized protein W97_01329 [Coniosporium apollinis CBS 100218]EON62110.1 hypothetical protein W97_01329 [Coniosporium apollinis CBS 100218]
MSSIGPEIPPHLLAKRKRQAEEEEDSATAPAPKDGSSRSSSPDSGEKRRRVIGPAAPPAPLDELPPNSTHSDEDSSSDDDGYGPALPSGDASKNDHTTSVFDEPPSSAPEKKQAQRDEWMMVPPKQDDLAARMDPTKTRARKFNTGRSARAPGQSGGGIDGVWTETPEQKRKRLENEVMGVTAPAAAGEPDSGRDRRKDAEAEETARRIREHNKSRGGSLYEQHKAQTPKDKEDDPSKRAFDREKDIAGGMKIGHAQRKEMLNRAADFGSRFAGGKYL